MRILFLLLLSSAGYAQTYNFQSITYTYYPTDTSGRMWEKTHGYKSFFILDSAKKRLIIPRVTPIQTATVRKDLLTGKVLTTVYDTAFSVGGRDTINLIAPYVITRDEDVRAIYGAGRVAAIMIFENLFVVYPEKSKYVRVVDFRK